MIAWHDRVRRSAENRRSTFSSAVFILVMVGFARFGNRMTLAVYALSFWHYYLYGLAYCIRAVSLYDFKRDAILMKTASLIAFASAYFATPLCPASLAIVAGGFLLNGIAAYALGSDRTYYGFELADLAPLRVTAFPYSVISHPMLVGNIAAFGGTLLNAEFRRQWWPLACGHMAMNAGLLLMERNVTLSRGSIQRFPSADAAARRRRMSLGLACILGVTAAVSAAMLVVWKEKDHFALLSPGVGTCIAVYTFVLYRCYSRPRAKPDAWKGHEELTT
jgi:hypothetical protein